jgi:hypothetical protein
MQKSRNVFEQCKRSKPKNDTVSGLLTTPKVEEIRKRSRSFTNCSEIAAELGNHEQMGCCLQN